MAEAARQTPTKAQPEHSQPSARWKERDLFGSLHDEIERVFEDFDKGVWGFPALRRRTEFLHRPRMAFTLMPTVDVIEKDDAFELTADLPGVDEKNIEIKVSADILTIKDEREERKEEKKKDYYISERQFGAFERAFRVPENVETDKIKAQFKNGVLTIALPKKPGAQKAEKKISISSS
jgi:HSP20 family protein